MNISVMHLDVAEHIKKLNCNYKIEESVMGLDVDVVFYDREWANVIGVLEIHGYHHFLRNKDVTTGTTAFKESIIKKHVKNYFFVDIQSWDILPEESKHDYIKKLLQNVCFNKEMK